MGYYDNEHDDEGEGYEGWIALGICALIGICTILVLWEPDVERIGTTVHSYLYGA
jgi:hypothetical protein